MDEFLRRRGIDEDTIKKLKDEGIDATVLTLMKDDDLKKYIPRYGDRIALFAYANQNHGSSLERKETLKEKLLQKLQKKRGPSEEHLKRSKSQSGNLNAKKMSRKVEIGWLHKNGPFCTLKQVRSPNGGGTRTVEIPMNCLINEIMITATELFFPGGVSKRGSVKDFELYMADQTHTKLEGSMCFQDLCDNTKLKHIRLYIVTCPHHMSGDGDGQTKIQSEVVSEVLDKAGTHSENFDDPNLPVVNVACEKAGPSQKTDACKGSSSESLPSLNLNDPGEYLIQIDGSGHSGSDFLDYCSTVHFADTEKHESSDVNQTTSSERNSAGEITDEVEEDNYVADFIRRSSEAIISSQFGTYDNKPGIIRIHRTIHELIQFYKDPAIIAKSLQFIFIDEQGHDAQGVSRDVYSGFWEEFLLKYTDGEDFRIPVLSNELGDCEWEAIGRILVKGYKDVKYFPVNIAPAFFVAMVIGELAVTPDILISSFMSFISKTEKDVLEQALAGAEHDPDELIELLDRFGCRSLPKIDTLKSMILQIAHRIMIQEPKYAIDALQRVGQLILTTFFPSAEHILSVYASCEPTIQKVLGLLNANPVSKEENESFMYLKKFIRGRQKGELKKFLHFLTGSDMLCVDKIEVTL